MAWLLLLTLACKDGPPPHGDTGVVDEDLALTLPDWGPHGVGFMTTELSYADPLEGVEGYEGTGDRPLYLAAWYPSTEVTAGEEIRYRGAFLRSDAVEGAAWAETPAGGFPVAVFSHGHQGFAEASSFLMAHLASHGWVVLAPDHTGNTTFDSADRTTDIFAHRPLDLSAVFDAALGGQIDGVAELDPDTLTLMGHSFGGYTLFATAGGAYDLDTLLPACEDGSGPSSFCSTMSDDYIALFSAGFEDERVKAWIPLAPGDHTLFGESGLGALNAPVLLQTGSVDPRTGDSSAPYWEALGGDDRHLHLEITGGGHQTFTDFSGTLEDPEGLIEAEPGWTIVKAVTLAFARRHGLQDETVQPVLDGEITWTDAMVWVP